MEAMQDSKTMSDLFRHVCWVGKMGASISSLMPQWMAQRATLVSEGREKAYYGVFGNAIWAMSYISSAKTWETVTSLGQIKLKWSSSLPLLSRRLSWTLHHLTHMLSAWQFRRHLEPRAGIGAVGMASDVAVLGGTSSGVIIS